MPPNAAAETAAAPETVTTTLDGVTRELRIYPRLSGDAFQHAADRDASNAVQALPLFPEFFRLFAGGYFDQMMRMENLNNTMRLGRDQGADLYARFVLAARILDVQELPELYLNGDARINAYAGGLHRPMVVLQRGILSILNEAELLAIIGHELGHVKCRHSLNTSLTRLFASVGVNTVASLFPVVGHLAALAIQHGLLHWSRMAEFSCDRAALLVVQDRQVVASALAKLAGFQEKHIPDFNFEALLRQIDDYERYDENTLQAAAKLQRTLVTSTVGRQNSDGSVSYGDTHPQPVLRVKRILDWGDSDQYRDILAGNYVRDTSTRPALAPHPAGSPKCSQCGNFMPTGSAFCSHCGQRL